MTGHGEVKEVTLDPSRPNRFIKIGTALDTRYEQVHLAFLQTNLEVFACYATDMPGIPREVAQHHLHVFPDAKPVQQRLRIFALVRKASIQGEVDRLKVAGTV